MKVMFIDDRGDEIARQWKYSGCGPDNLVVPFEPFMGLERTLELVQEHRPDVIVIGHGLSHPTLTGSHVILHLQANGYEGHFIANSGGGVRPFERDGVEVKMTANRDPIKLAKALNEIAKMKNNKGECK